MACGQPDRRRCCAWISGVLAMMTHFKRFSFTGAEGVELAGRLDLPVGTPRGYALFAHCFTCTKNILAAARIAEGLAQRGIATLRFDFTGLGASGGDFANTNFSSNVADLVAAADALRRSYAAPQLLIGHSLGGAAVLAAAAQVPEAVGVATIAAPADPAHVVKLFTAAVPQIEAHGEAEVLLEGRPFRIRKQFLEDLAGLEHGGVAQLGKALLLFHAPGDAVVDIDNARRIFEAARHPKSFVSLAEADHLLSRREDAAYVAEVIAAWASRYLGAAVAESSNEAGVLVRELGADAAAGVSHLAQEVLAGSHRLLADEPRAAGGSDLGPNPYDLLLAALGACKSMTLRLYAARKGWPVERIAVALRHEKIHAVDCAECETKEGKIDRIDVELMVEGALDEAQRGRLLEIADRCPVHRSLSAEKQIRSRLREA
jgi:putative redox protein